MYVLFIIFAYLINLFVYKYTFPVQLIYTINRFIFILSFNLFIYSNHLLSLEIYLLNI